MSSWSTLVQLVGTATGQTLIMVFFSTLFSFILGAPLGVLLCITAEGNLMPRPVLHQLIDRVVNVLRSFPFIILMILLFPFSRLIIGTSIGTAATVVPLRSEERFSRNAETDLPPLLHGLSKAPCWKSTAVLSKRLSPWALLLWRLSLK